MDALRHPFWIIVRGFCIDTLDGDMCILVITGNLQQLSQTTVVCGDFPDFVNKGIGFTWILLEGLQSVHTTMDFVGLHLTFAQKRNDFFISPVTAG